MSRGAGCGRGPARNLSLSRWRGEMPGCTAAWSASRLSEASAIAWSSLSVSRAERASTRARFGGAVGSVASIRAANMRNAAHDASMRCTADCGEKLLGMTAESTANS